MTVTAQKPYRFDLIELIDLGIPVDLILEEDLKPSVAREYSNSHCALGCFRYTIPFRTSRRLHGFSAEITRFYADRRG